MKDSEATKVLVVEDNLADAVYIQEMLPEEQYKVTQLATIKAALAAAGAGVFDIVLLDLSLPDSHGLSTCEKLITHLPNMPVVVLTGLDDEQTAIEAVRLGAQDYLFKQDISERNLTRIIRYAVERKRGETEIRRSTNVARQAEATAREATKNMLLALKASKTGIWSFDLMTQKITTDDQIDAIFGVEHGSFGTNVEDFLKRLHHEDRMKVESAGIGASENRSDFDVEYRVVWPDGSIHYISDQGHVIEDVDGTPVRMAGVCRDISRQKKEQEDAQRLALLEQHEDFIATLSHDLKNPLIGASRMFDLLIAGRFGALPEEQEKTMKLMKQSNTDMLGLIYNLLDVYRLDHGAPELTITQVNVESVVKDCIKLFEVQAEDRDISVLPEFSEGKHTVEADSLALKRVISNLLGNALKFTRKGGTIKICGTAHGGNYKLQIKDTGIGIAAEDMDKLFTRFSRTVGGKKHSSSTGLGLYLCKQLIEAHKGTIGCQSTPGTKTIFTVSLPLKE